MFRVVKQFRVCFLEEGGAGRVGGSSSRVWRSQRVVVAGRPWKLMLEFGQ